MSAGAGRRTRTIDATVRMICAVVSWSIVGLACAGVGVVVVRGLGALTSTGVGAVAGVAASLAIVAVALAIAGPTGIAAAIWLEGRPPGHLGRRIVDVDLSILASLPPLVYGVAALVVLGGRLDWFSGAVSVALMILPGLIERSRAAIAEVSPAELEAGYALGGSRGRLLLELVIPAAARGLGAAVASAGARALGAAAPLLVLIWLGASPESGALGSPLPLRAYAGLGAGAADPERLAVDVLALLIGALGLELLARVLGPATPEVDA